MRHDVPGNSISLYQISSQSNSYSPNKPPLPINHLQKTVSATSVAINPELIHQTSQFNFTTIKNDHKPASTSNSVIIQSRIPQHEQIFDSKAITAFS